MTTQRWVNRPDGSNWGDFGADDQVGRMNLITPEARLRGAREIREGLSFSLSLPLDYPGGNVLFPLRKEPVFHYEERGSGHNFNFQMSEVAPSCCDVISDDAVTLYTQYSTQWDALAHVGQMFDADGDGKPEKVYYNGYRAGKDIIGPDDEGPRGAAALGIDKLAVAGVQGRGVLVDLEKRHGQDRVLIGYDGLVEAIDELDVSVENGDFLCLNTGFAQLVLSMDKEPDATVLASSCAVLDGRDEKLLDWITDSGIVAICADNFAVEAYPARETTADKFAALPLHNHCLFKLGIHLGELWYFAELTAWLREHNRSAFFLTAPPLRLPGSVGSPVNPIATV
ncbi:cyclase family protein [Paracoccus sediminicola]|uniref:cyclase family protein n=1 Tax=Paracoccus sediminicola TaxID=3017783 RepID=UPI0022F021C7|nr:cyclase family protein [Paracoccus sediminicola]WBU56230.1 cyclase family protein [Paracoccus sediminicola]